MWVADAISFVLLWFCDGVSWVARFALVWAVWGWLWIVLLFLSGVLGAGFCVVWICGVTSGGFVAWFLVWCGYWFVC